MFRVLQRHADRYEVELADEGAGFIGRLKLRYAYRERATRVKLENHYTGFDVQEICANPIQADHFQVSRTLIFLSRSWKRWCATAVPIGRPRWEA